MTARAEIVAAVRQQVADTLRPYLPQGREFGAFVAAQAVESAADKAVSLCFARAAEMAEGLSDETLDRFRHRYNRTQGNQIESLRACLPIISGELRALSHPPATTHSTQSAASATPQQTPASAARLSADDSK